MSQFKVHFFKEKSRAIDIETIIAFFDLELGLNVEMDDQSVRFIYEHETLHVKCLFMITPKTTVPDIYRLSPKYLDVNMHFEMPILTNQYMANIFFKMIEKVAKRFHFFVYHPLFEDVLSFNYDVLMQVFHMVKDATIRKDMSVLSPYEVIDSQILYHLYKYSDDMSDLKTFYEENQTTVPTYDLKKCPETLYVGFHWYQNTQTVIPPYVNVCYVHIDQEVKMIDYLSVVEKLEKFLSKVPGTIEGTMVVEKKYIPKIMKILKKMNPIKPSCETPKSVPMKKLMDIES